MPRFLTQQSAYGSILLGSGNESTPLVRLRIWIVLSGGITIVNLTGIACAGILLFLGIREPSLLQPEMQWLNFIAIPLYVVAVYLVAHLVLVRRVVGATLWAVRGDSPTPRAARRALRAPRTLFRGHLIAWWFSAGVLTAAYGVIDPETIPKVLLVMVLTGIEIACFAYLLGEFALRPVAAIVLESRVLPKNKTRTGGILGWSVISWVVGSGIPMLGILIVVGFALVKKNFSAAEIGIASATLVVIAVISGPFLCVLSASRVADPVRMLTHAMNDVQKGDYDVRVRVFDGSTLGHMQAGFNDMADGLQERERVRELYGRQVGHSVANASMIEAPELGGDERTVAVLFVDLSGSTGFAARQSAHDVVEVLNRFCHVVVAAVERVGGLVNKFEGDAVLAIFGAPEPMADAAGSALAAAREIGRELPRSVPELRAGCGVSFGEVVAGYVGTADRFEYTVIGDTVNAAARLSDEAKQDDCGGTLAADSAVTAASAEEQRHWRPAGERTLRGRSMPTPVFVPSSPPYGMLTE